jgi:dolichol-phosphate mannosyltransferase
MRSALILPCYNVERNVEQVITQLIPLIKKGIIKEIIAVDDGSKDNTLKILKKYESNNFIIIKHEKNKGKGKAMDNAAKLAIKRKIDAFVFFDADGEHDIQVIEKSLKKLKNYDVIYGSRFRETKKEKVLIARMLMAQVFACLFKRLFNINTTDPYCGFKAIKARAYQKISPKEERYDIELEMLIKAKIRKLKTAEIKIPLLNVAKWKIEYEKKKKKSISDFANWIDAQVEVIKKIIKEENYELNVKI